MRTKAELQTARAVAPDLDHLRRENSIPATPPRPDAEPSKVTVVTLKSESEMDPAALAEIKKFRRELRIKEALRMQDPTASKTTNASLHVVDTPGGVAAYHKERQRAALEVAKELKGEDRKFALRLAKDHAQAKRSAAAGGQPRVPAGSPEGGQWTKG